MANPYRILSVGVLGAFAAALGAVFVGARKDDAPPPPPRWLPEAHAAPVEHVRHEKLRYGHTLGELLQQLRVDGSEASAILAQLPDSAADHEVREGREYDLRLSTRTGGVRRLTLQLDADRILKVDGRKGAVRARVDSVEVRYARNANRALRAAELRFSRHYGVDWSMRADVRDIEAV